MRRLTLLAIPLLLAACSVDGDGDGDGDGESAADPSSSRPTVVVETDTPSPDPTRPVAGDHRLGLDLIEGAAPFEYLLHAPAAVEDGRPLPLVLVFHGSPGSPEDMVRMTGFDALADEEDFLVVYPDSYSDPAHVVALLDHLADHWPVDEDRVYAAGFSRGAATTYVLAEEVSDEIAAFAPVSGIQNGSFALRRTPSLITFQGENDEFADAFPRVNRDWARAAGCGAPDVGAVPLGGRTAHRAVAQCADGAEHHVYRVERMGHVWPRQASRLIWDFFAAHPLVSR